MIFLSLALLSTVSSACLFKDITTLPIPLGSGGRGGRGKRREEEGWAGFCYLLVVVVNVVVVVVP